MQAAKERIYNIAETLSASQLNEAVNFMLFIKMRKENRQFNDLVAQSASSTDFWDNDIDDEAWNAVWQSEARNH